MQFRTGVLFTAGDVRVAADIANRIAGFQQSAHLPQHLFLSPGIPMPVGGRFALDIHKHLLQLHLPPALRHKTSGRPCQTPQIVQFDTDRKTVETGPSGITALPGMPGFHVKRHQLDDFPRRPITRWAEAFTSGRARYRGNDCALTPAV